jgi:hypothetical protein
MEKEFINHETSTRVYEFATYKEPLAVLNGKRVY